LRICASFLWNNCTLPLRPYEFLTTDSRSSLQLQAEPLGERVAADVAELQIERGEVQALEAAGLSE
jgi:hypothetical protein